MIDNTQKSNIQLTDTQTLQIEEAKKRLSNLQGEISASQSNFRAIKSDTEKAINERNYNESLLSEIEKKVIESQKTLDILSVQITEKNITLERIQAESNLATDSNTAKTIELNEREIGIGLKEKEYEKKVEAQSKEKEQILADKKLIASAKETFKQAIEKIVW